MKTTYNDLPGWEFEIIESTPGGYVVKGCGPRGLELSFQGNDSHTLLERARAAALDVSEAAEARLRSPSSEVGSSP